MSKKTKLLTYFAISAILLSALLYCGYHAWYLNRAFHRIEKDPGGIPVKMAVLKRMPPLGNSESRLVKLSLTNNADGPRWYLFHPFLGDTLPPDGLFDNRENQAYAEGRKFPHHKSGFRIVSVQFWGKNAPDNSFTAFYLPPQSTVSLENYHIFARVSARNIQVWEVEHLLIDGQIPFESRLTDDVLSTGNVRLAPEVVSGENYAVVRSECLECEEEGAPDRPAGLLQGEVNYIQATGIRKFEIKME